MPARGEQGHERPPRLPWWGIRKAFQAISESNPQGEIAHL